MIGRKVIVRASRAGVFFGTLVKFDGENATLKNVRKLWYWDGAGAVEGIAQNGVSKPDECKFTVWVGEIGLTGVSQIIPATEKSINIIEGIEEWLA